MAGIKYIRASDGTGEAVRAIVQSGRSPGALTLTVDSVDNFSPFFIATTGKLLSTGILDPTTINQFHGRIQDNNILIETFEPGHPDIGNAYGDVVLIKPTTPWANEIATILAVAHEDDGTIKTSIIDGIKNSINTAVSVFTNKRIKPRTYSVTTTASLVPDLTNYNVYLLSAQAAAITIGAPLGTPSDGEVIVIRIKDDGTSRAITWNAIFKGVGDTLLASTTAGKWHYINGMYNANTAKWDMLPAITEV